MLNAYLAEDDREKKELESIRQELGFDPCSHSERLRFSSGTSRRERDPKGILSRLTRDNYEREVNCWNTAPLYMLRSHGEKTYLKHYLDEVRDHLLRLLNV